MTPALPRVTSRNTDDLCCCLQQTPSGQLARVLVRVTNHHGPFRHLFFIFYFARLSFTIRPPPPFLTCIFLSLFSPHPFPSSCFLFPLFFATLVCRGTVDQNKSKQFGHRRQCFSSATTISSTLYIHTPTTYHALNPHSALAFIG